MRYFARNGVVKVRYFAENGVVKVRYFAINGVAKVRYFARNRVVKVRYFAENGNTLLYIEVNGNGWMLPTGCVIAVWRKYYVGCATA